MHVPSDGVRHPGKRPKVAFVATGGAAKGLAHLGVLRAAEELGLRFDMFVGSSSGALVSAFYGQGVALDRLVDSFRSPWKRRFAGPHLVGRTFAGAPRLADFANPGYLASGLFSIDPLERYLRERLPQNDFRKIDRSIYVVGIDLDSTDRVVFGRGYVEDVPVSQAVAASCCVPLLFRPYPINGRYYVDGETKKTFSADIAIEQAADVLVISNVYTPQIRKPGRKSIAFEGMRSVWNQTLNLVLHEKSLRGLDLYKKLYPEVQIVLIEPNIGHLGFLNRFRAREFVERGYREALKQLSAAQARGTFSEVRRLRAVGAP
ncbi:MAG: patatin-like phospholipase family protein [Myxococcota bacterium]